MTVVHDGCKRLFIRSFWLAGQDYGNRYIFQMTHVKSAFPEGMGYGTVDEVDTKIIEKGSHCKTFFKKFRVVDASLHELFRK